MNNYDSLIAQFPLKPIKSEQDLNEAEKIVEELLDRGNFLDSDENDYLQVLLHIVEAYEDVHHPIPDVSAKDVILSLLEDRELQVDDLADDIKVIVLCIINDELGTLTINDLDKLGTFFNTSPTVFLPVN